jgi:hypothetical protein
MSVHSLKCRVYSYRLMPSQQASVVLAISASFRTKKPRIGPAPGQSGTEGQGEKDDKRKVFQHLLAIPSANSSEKYWGYWLFQEDDLSAGMPRRGNVDIVQCNGNEWGAL